jgi:hypothetical protein
LFGHSFAVVTDHFKAVPELRDRVRLYGLENNCRAVDAIDWFVTDMVLDPMTVAKDTYVKVQDVMRTTGAETVVIGCTIVSACYELAALRGDADLAALSVVNPNVMAVKLAEMFADLASTKQYRISRSGYYQQHTSHDAEEAGEIMGLLSVRSSSSAAASSAPPPPTTPPAKACRSRCSSSATPGTAPPAATRGSSGCTAAIPGGRWRSHSQVGRCTTSSRTTCRNRSSSAPRAA